MQEHPFQPLLQPWLKLAQNNLARMNRFSFAPEVVSQAMAQSQNLFHQMVETSTRLTHSNAYAELVQGLMRNYSEFLSELGQGSMAVLSAGQADWLQQAQQAGQVIELARRRA